MRSVSELRALLAAYREAAAGALVLGTDELDLVVVTGDEARTLNAEDLGPGGTLAIENPRVVVDADEDGRLVVTGGVLLDAAQLGGAASALAATESLRAVVEEWEDAGWPVCAGSPSSVSRGYWLPIYLTSTSAKIGDALDEALRVRRDMMRAAALRRGA